MMDNGVYKYAGEYNGYPWYQNTQNSQKLFWKKNCQGPHWGTYKELNQKRLNTRSKGITVGCPETVKEWSLPTELKCVDGPSTTSASTRSTRPSTTASSTRQTTSQSTRPSTQPTTPDPKPTPEPTSCIVPTQQGSCVDIDEYCNFKASEKTDGLNENSRAKVVCRQHHRLNIEYTKDPYTYGQTSTYAYCRCENNQCEWKFNKGDVQCTLCPREHLQARTGKKQRFVEWDTGIAIYYPITVDARSVDGWHVALDFNAELEGGASMVNAELVEDDDLPAEHDVQRRFARANDDIYVHSGNMDLTGVSENNRIWTFTPNHSSLDVANLSNKKVWLLAYFENLSASDIKKAKKAALLYFRYKMPGDSANCLVDRFAQYPLTP